MGQSTSSFSKRVRRSDPGGAGERAREVQALFDDLATALASGDVARVAALWEAPAFVLGDGMASVVGSLDEVKTFLGAARDQYNERGVIDTRAELVRVDWPTKQIAIVEVHWPHLDSSGTEVGGERATYTLRRDSSGSLKIRAVVMHGEEVGQGAHA